MVAINEKTTRIQSLNAYNQWKVQWRAHSKHHSQYEMKSFSDFENVGVGKALLCIGNGASFEQEIDTIRELQDNVDIYVCDKTLGHCIENGIIPTYCMVCDANVDYDKYLKPWQDKIKDVTLISNVCGNIKWTNPEYWKDMYFFVNEDVIHSEKEFSKLSGCKNFIPAATNVSGEMIVSIFQSNNKGRRNFFAYDKTLLIGFDYSWEADGKYYAFDEDGEGKHQYMRHVYGINQGNKLCYTSNNLLFSMEWLKKYINTFKLPVVNCAKNSILEIGAPKELSEQMVYSCQPGDKDIVRSITKNRLKLLKEIKTIEVKLRDIAKVHSNGFLASI